jgi:hypothetical protein
METSDQDRKIEIGDSMSMKGFGDSFIRLGWRSQAA